jgi:hypothetical protein
MEGSFMITDLARKVVLALVLTVASLHAETVFLTAHGKTFHKSEHCMALSRATHVYSADRAAAEAHKLHACGICYRAAGKKSAADRKGLDWAQEVATTTGKGK